MKKLSITIFLTVFFGCFLGKAQVIRQAAATATPFAPIATSPGNISQFEVSGRLITQNAFVGTGAIPLGQQTGEFGTAARWCSMGTLNAGTQIFTGFRAQTNGKGFTMGYSGGATNNPTIQWIGNAGASVTPGSLDFKYALSPGSPGVPQTDVTLFKMVPDANNSATSNNNSYALNGLLGHYVNNGTVVAPTGYNTFGIDDQWISIGNPSNFSYGKTTQWKGQAFNTILRDRNNGSLVKDAFIEWGNQAASNFILRFISNPALPTNDKEVMVANNERLVRFGNLVASLPGVANVVVGGGFTTSTLNDGTTGIGLFAEGLSSTATQIGLYGRASGAAGLNAGIGVVGEAVGTVGTFNTGVLSIGRCVSTAGFINGSDSRLKKEIATEKNAITTISKLRPTTYYFDSKAHPGLHFDNNLQHGFIAQEVEKILPELVQEFQDITNANDKTAYKAMNYIGIISLLTKGIQEQQEMIQSLQNDLEVLKSTQQTTLTINKGFSLSQNVPNPFSGTTTISYQLPANTSNAILGIFDLNGKMLLQYNLAKSSNQVTINGNTLTAGIYIYSLIVNGNEVISKRMVLTK